MLLDGLTLCRQGLLSTPVKLKLTARPHSATCHTSREPLQRAFFGSAGACAALRCPQFASNVSSKQLGAGSLAAASEERAMNRRTQSERPLQPEADLTHRIAIAYAWRHNIATTRERVVHCAGCPQHVCERCQSSKEVVMEQANLGRRYVQLEGNPPLRWAARARLKQPCSPTAAQERTTSSSSVDDACFVCPLHGVTELQG